MGDDEWISRQKFPATPDHIFTRLFLEIGHDCTAGKLESRSERKTNCAEHAKAESRGENGGVRSTQPDDVEREHFSQRGHEKVGRPEAQEEPAGTAEEREHQAFGKKLADDAAAAATQRETNGNFFATRCAAGQQHVREIKTRHQQHHDGHPEKHRRDLRHPALARWARAGGETGDRRGLERLILLLDRECFLQIGGQALERRLSRSGRQARP